MSQENVELVRRVMEAWEKGDFAFAAQALDPEIQFETFMPDARKNVRAQGMAEVAAFTQDWLAQWRDYRIAPDDLREVEPDTVFVSVRQIATGEQSGAVVESPGYCVFRLRDGKVVGLTLHYERDKALEAAGLRE